jgi:two-component system cell cycle response regulator
LLDAAGREIAHMILLNNETPEVNKIRETIFIGCFAMLAAGFALFIIFYWLVGKIGQRIEHDEKKLQNLAIRDGLTGLFNHRTFYSLLDDEIKRSLRHNRPLSLLMLDIDHFKHVNDTYGHRVGDMILHGLSDLLLREARETDRVCRYGGEEIVLILPEIDEQGAMGIAERLRKAIAAYGFETENGKQISITVSIGVAVYPKDTDTKETLVAVADDAMYAAKQSGRNRVCRNHPSLDE